MKVLRAALCALVLGWAGQAIALEAWARVTDVTITLEDMDTSDGHQAQLTFVGGPGIHGYPDYWTDVWWWTTAVIANKFDATGAEVHAKTVGDPAYAASARVERGDRVVAILSPATRVTMAGNYSLYASDINTSAFAIFIMHPEAASDWGNMGSTPGLASVKGPGVQTGSFVHYLTSPVASATEIYFEYGAGIRLTRGGIVPPDTRPPIPEPATYMLMLAGLAALLARHHRARITSNH